MKQGVPAEALADRLRSAAGVQRVPNPKLELFIIRGFLDADSCARLRALIDQNRRPSTIADDLGIAGFRTSETCDLDPAHPAVDAFRSALTALTAIPLSHAEPLQQFAVAQQGNPYQSTRLLLDGQQRLVV